MRERERTDWFVTRKHGVWQVSDGRDGSETKTFTDFDEAVEHARRMAWENRPADVFAEGDDSGELALVVSYG